MGLKRASVYAGVALLLYGASGPTSAQATQERDTPVFGVGITLVAVPVFVTDKAGNSVPGLKAEDFVVEDGGKRVRIVSFQAVDVNAASTVASQSQAAELPLVVQAEAPRQFLVLLDLRFTPGAGVIRGRRAAATFVRDSLAPRDLVAAATYGQGGLRVLANFSTDHANVARAIEGTSLERLVGTDPLGLSGGLGEGGRIGFGGGMDGGGGGSAVSGAGGIADQEAAEVDELMRQAGERLYRSGVTDFLQSLEKLVGMIGPLRGRKQILLLSGGFAEWAWDSAVSAASDSAEGEPVRGRMSSLYRAAGEADVVIHAISLGGIEQGRQGQQPGQALDNQMSVRSIFNQNSGRGTLQSFAAHTGGRFVLPTNDFSKAFHEVDRVSRHSYVIAFEAGDTQKDGGKPRRLKLKTLRPGLSVSHRPSYLLSPSKSGDDVGAGELAARESLSKGLSGGPLRLRLTTLPYRDPQGHGSVQAALRIEGNALAESAQGTALAVQVYGYSMSGGRVLDSVALKTSVDLSKLGEAVRRSGITLLTAFPASPGDQELRFFVRTGAAAGITGTIREDVSVPAFEGDTVVSAPIFTASPIGRVVVPFQPETRPRISVPFHVENERFVPDAVATLVPGRPREVCVFVWRDRSASSGPPTITAAMARGGDPALAVRVEGAPRVVSDPDGFDRYLVRVVAPEAPVGAYTFRLTFVEPGTGRTVTTESAVVLAGPEGRR